MRISIKAIQRVSFIDFPGKICSIIFTGGCNFRCPFCHNPSLVLNKGETLCVESVLSVLRKKAGWVEGCVITGGEPTIWPELPKLITEIKKLGFDVKLDTNGSNPTMLRMLLKKNLLDYVAMDIKGPSETYKEICGFGDVRKIEKSIELVRQMKNYEFRTTVIPRFHKRDELLEIARWLKGAKCYVLQRFVNNVRLLDPRFESEPRYSLAELESFARLLKPYFEKVVVR